MSNLVVLLVDDDPDDRTLIRRAFAKSSPGISLRVTRDGEEAEAYLIGRKPFDDRAGNPIPSLVLLDLKLPRLTGFDLLELIKKDPALREIPVVILSSSREDKDIHRASTLGAAAYLVKPTDYDKFHEVARAVREYLTLGIPNNLKSLSHGRTSIARREVYIPRRAVLQIFADSRTVPTIDPLIRRDGPKELVLYLEHDPVERDTIQHAFTQGAAHVVLQMAATRDEAVSYLAGEPPYQNRREHPLPALLLLDLDLPRQSAFEILDWIRRDPPSQYIPVIVTSQDPRLYERAFEAGATSSLAKSVSFDDLVEVAKNVGLYTNSAVRQR